MLTPLRRILLFGGLQVLYDDRTITRFATRKTGSLLAYLAHNPTSSPTREQLVALLWPNDDEEAGRNRLRVALTALRRQLEPSDFHDGEVIVADRVSIRLNPTAFTTDTVEFLQALEAAYRVPDEQQKIAHLVRAVDLYRGDLLPDYDEEWVRDERERFAHACLHALQRLVRCLVRARELDLAIEYARRALAMDALREETHRDLMRLYVAVKQPSAALQQYQELERLLRTELNSVPCAATRALARQIKASLGHSIKAQRSPVEVSSIGFAVSTLPAATVATSDLKRPGNLPSRLTRFFGREEELSRLCAMLMPEAAGIQDAPPAQRRADENRNDTAKPVSSLLPLSSCARLITLAGPGGTGKTRLALEIGASLQTAYAGRVWFVSLSELADPRLIARAIAAALQLPRPAGIEPFEQVAEALAREPTLLILDNFEHLAAEGAALVAALLSRAASLTCLITSRRTLGLSGERCFPVAPLPTPPYAGGIEGEGDINGISEDNHVSGQEHEGRREYHTAFSPPLLLSSSLLLSYPSVQLFVDRAQAVRPDFQLTAHNASDVAKLCCRLDGIPLAIELAAARMAVMTPGQMLAHLGHSLTLLVNRRAGKDDRHRSLRATIEWSYQLLTPSLRRFFARLAVFQGGWTLDAAEYICSADLLLTHSAPKLESGVVEVLGEADPLSPVSCLDMLDQLRADSLILAEENGQEMRFRMLETLREFAAEQLIPAEREHLQRLHYEYFSRFAEEADRKLKGTDQSRWLERLEVDHDNLRAALTWATKAASDTQSGVRLAASLGWFWILKAHFAEGLDWLRSALSRLDDTTPTRLSAHALNVAGMLAFRMGESTRVYHEEALGLAVGEDDLSNMAYALLGLGNLAWAEDVAVARLRYTEALSRFRELDDRWGLATALNSLGVALLDQGEYEGARALCEEGLAVRRAIGDAWGMAASLNTLGYVACAERDTAVAQARFEQAIDILQSIGHQQGLAYAVAGLANVASLQGDVSQAYLLHGRSLRLYQQVMDRRGMALQLERLADLAAKRNQVERSVVLSGVVSALYVSMGLHHKGGLAHGRAADLDAVDAAQHKEDYAFAWERGCNMTLDQAIAYALEE